MTRSHPLHSTVNSIANIGTINFASIDDHAAGGPDLGIGAAIDLDHMLAGGARVI